MGPFLMNGGYWRMTTEGGSQNRRGELAKAMQSIAPTNAEAKDGGGWALCEAGCRT